MTIVEMVKPQVLVTNQEHAGVEVINRILY